MFPCERLLCIVCMFNLAVEPCRRDINLCQGESMAKICHAESFELILVDTFGTCGYLWTFGRLVFIP